MRLQLLSSLAPPFGFPMASSRHCLGPVLDFSGTAFPGAGSSREGVGLGWMGRKQRSQSVRPILTSALVVEPRPRHFPAVTTVDSLLPGTSGHNLVVKVVSSSVQVSKTRVDGTKITVAEVSRRPMAIFRSPHHHTRFWCPHTPARTGPRRRCDWLRHSFSAKWYPSRASDLSCAPAGIPRVLCAYSSGAAVQTGRLPHAPERQD